MFRPVTTTGPSSSLITRMVPSAEVFVAHFRLRKVVLGRYRLFRCLDRAKYSSRSDGILVQRRLEYGPLNFSASWQDRLAKRFLAVSRPPDGFRSLPSARLNPNGVSGIGVGTIWPVWVLVPIDPSTTIVHTSTPMQGCRSPFKVYTTWPYSYMDPLGFVNHHRICCARRGRRSTPRLWRLAGRPSTLFLGHTQRLNVAAWYIHGPQKGYHAMSEL